MWSAPSASSAQSNGAGGADPARRDVEVVTQVLRGHAAGELDATVIVEVPAGVEPPQGVGQSFTHVASPPGLHAMTEDSAVDAPLVVEPQRFAVVPEWTIAADVNDSAFRLYVVLLRYGSTSGIRMPCRSTSLASQLRKNSVDTVDRALKELQALGAVTVERRRDGERWLTNRYHVRTGPPGRADAATPRWPDLEALAARCQQLRRTLSAPTARWTPACLSIALDLAVRHRGWPQALAYDALLAVAADPMTRSPMRLAETGSGWETAETGSAAGRRIRQRWESATSSMAQL